MVNKPEQEKHGRSLVVTLKKLTDWILLGFGQGHGKEYEPWLHIRRKNSSPNSNQVVAWMPPLERTAHYFSRGEYFTALLLLWLGVLDLREQFPLWPIAHPHPLTGAAGADSLNFKWARGLIEIARDAGIKHGVEVGTRIPYVATIDLMATVQLAGGLKLFGFSSKGISDSDAEVKARTLERLELERQYMAEIGGGYFVTNSGMVPDLMAGQLETWLDCSELSYAPELLSLVDEFAKNINEQSDLSIVEALNGASKLLQITHDQAWLLFRHCAWTQKIDIDPTECVITSYPIRRGGVALRSKLRVKLFGEDWI